MEAALSIRSCGREGGLARVGRTVGIGTGRSFTERLDSGCPPLAQEGSSVDQQGTPWKRVKEFIAKYGAFVIAGLRFAYDLAKS
jgi:hypothetical protein